MKKTIVLPLFLGLMLAGCGRTNTDSQKIATNNPPDAPKPIVADDKAATAKPNYSNQASVVAASPTTAPDPTKDATAATPNSADNSSPMAANPMPLASTAPAAFGSSPAASNPTPAIPASTDMASATTDAMPAISGRISEWKLAPADIKGEFESSGQVVRSKTPGAGEPTGPMDSILVTQINAKLQADTDTSAQKISVAADKGVVTLTGSAGSLDQIGKAIALSLDTGGVTQTISQIKLEPSP